MTDSLSSREHATTEPAANAIFIFDLALSLCLFKKVVPNLYVYIVYIIVVRLKFGKNAALMTENQFFQYMMYSIYFRIMLFFNAI